MIKLILALVLMAPVVVAKEKPAKKEEKKEIQALKPLPGYSSQTSPNEEALEVQNHLFVPKRVSSVRYFQRVINRELAKEREEQSEGEEINEGY